MQAIMASTTLSPVLPSKGQDVTLVPLDIYNHPYPLMGYHIYLVRYLVPGSYANIVKQFIFRINSERHLVLLYLPSLCGRYQPSIIYYGSSVEIIIF